MEGKCVKQQTIAIIENNGQYWMGTNHCANAQQECPSGNLHSGIGYELCASVCQQGAHAEVDACQKAQGNAMGGTLYLLGHTYCCDNCKSVMEQYGIKEVIIGSLPPSMIKVMDFK